MHKPRQIQSLEAPTRRDLAPKAVLSKFRLETDSDRLKTLRLAREDIAQQKQTLQNVRDASCPLCGSELDQRHREEVAVKLSNQLGEQRAQIAQLEAGNSKSRSPTRTVSPSLSRTSKTNSPQPRARPQRLAEKAEAAVKKKPKMPRKTRETTTAQIRDLKAQLREQTQNSPEAARPVQCPQCVGKFGL